jgi:hypothetical protein
VIEEERAIGPTVAIKATGAIEPIEGTGAIELKEATEVTEVAEPTEPTEGTERAEVTEPTEVREVTEREFTSIATLATVRTGTEQSPSIEAATAVGGVQRTGIGCAADTDTTGVLA